MPKINLKENNIYIVMYHYVREKNIEAYGVLMMSHMASKERLLEEAKKMKKYGAQGIILMDSAGSYLLDDVKEKLKGKSTYLVLLLILSPLPPSDI